MYENLQMGSTGNSVIILQQKLKNLGLYNAPINSYFGLATEIGVKEFQRNANLPINGIVDNNTWQKLNEYTEEARIKFNYRQTANIMDIQKKLKALLYYTGPITGNLDLETENAIKRFQLNNGITANGNLNNETLNLLNKLYGNLNECVTGDNISNNYTTYTVVRGDTLYSIARKFNTTVNEIKSLNNLTSDTLLLGQQLLIPTLDYNDNDSDSDNYINYTVSLNDTLYSIANRYNTTVDEIKKINNLTSNLLQVGQVLKIPTTSNNSNYINYTVLRGNTLYSIAKKFNVSVNTIAKENNLFNDILMIGQVLRIPISTQESDYIYYKVVRGDTLYSIARQYNTTVDMLKEINNLTSNTLSIGQELRIPRT